MKTRLASASIATVLAAALLLAPGLSPAQAGTKDLGTASPSISKPALDPSLGNGPVGGAGDTATTYGMWHLPCDFLGFRLC